MRVARAAEMVHADPDAVFSYLAQIERHVEWSGQERYGLDEIEMLTPGAVGLGTRWRSVGRNVTGRHNQDESEITEFEPPRRLAWATQFRLGAARAKFTGLYILTPAPEGTLVSAKSSVWPQNLPGLLLLAYLGITRPRLGKELVSGGLRRFKEAVEGRAIGSE